MVSAVFGLVMFKDEGEVVKLTKKLRDLDSQVKRYKKELVTMRSMHYTLDSIIGNSRAIAELKQEALMAAANTYPIGSKTLARTSRVRAPFSMMMLPSVSTVVPLNMATLIGKVL